MSYQAPPSIEAHLIVFGFAAAGVLTPLIAIAALIVALLK